MSFYDYSQKFLDFDLAGIFERTSRSDVLASINNERPDVYDFARLLSPAASECLEEMAQQSRQNALKYFGRAVILYTPIYIDNHCVNRCVYCGFNTENQIKRKQLSLEEIEAEARAISATGLRHILVLTGESPKGTPVEYIEAAVKVMKPYFDSIAIEIYPLDEEGYARLIAAGVDSMTVYQEVYNPEVYKEVHLGGPKRNYRNRLEAPERALSQKMHSVNIGALLGLDDWRREAFLTGLHVDYLQRKFPEAELALSFPRIRPHAGSFEVRSPVDDADLVQIMTAMKIFIPRAGITLSTRESASLRENLLPLGVSKMSAGVCTSVGGRTQKDQSTSQFEISDGRSVDEMKAMLLSKGYQPVFKDWVRF